jgi:hypothetical protein
VVWPPAQKPEIQRFSASPFFNKAATTTTRASGIRPQVVLLSVKIVCKKIHSAAFFQGSKEHF